MMPAFSPAISASVFPSTAMWSYDNEVMTETFGVTIFVASSRPPKPTSITAALTSFFANASKSDCSRDLKRCQFGDFRNGWLDLFDQFDQLLM